MQCLIPPALQVSTMNRLLPLLLLTALSACNSLTQPVKPKVVAEPEVFFDLAKIPIVQADDNRIFSLSGKDNGGHQYDGTLRIEARGLVEVGGQSLYQSESIVLVSSETGALISSTSSSFIDPTSLQIRFSQNDDTAIRCRANPEQSIPARASDGASGPTPEQNCSDGSKATGRWSLKQIGPELAEYTLTTEYLTADETPKGRELSRFVISTEGHIERVHLEYHVPPGFSLVLDGE